MKVSLVLLLLVVLGCLVENGRGFSVEERGMKGEVSEVEEEKELLMSKYTKARQAFNNNDYPTALSILENLLPYLGEEQPSTYADLAVAYMYSGRIEDAYQTYKDGLEVHPQEGMLHRGLCQFGSQVHKTSYQPEGLVAEDVIESCVFGINKKPREAIMYQHTARILYGEGMYNEAITFLERGASIVQKVYDRQQNNIKRGKEDRIDKESDAPNIQLYFEMTESLAILQLQKGDPNKALGLAEILLDLDYEKFSPLVARIRTFFAPYDQLGSGLLKETLVEAAGKCESQSCSDNGFDIEWDWGKYENEAAKIELINEDTALLPFGPSFFVGEEEEKQQYSTHKIYHIEMKHFFFNGPEGYISQSCKFLPGTHKQLLGFSDICIEEKPKKMSYHVPIFSLLPQFEASNYFNWMMEGLTRIVKFQDMFPEAFEDGKYRMLTPQQNGGFVGETLRLLLGEKGMEKIVSLPGGVVGMKTPVHILDWQPEDSIVYKHNTFSALFPPKEMLELARSRILELVGEEKKGGLKVVYVKRDEKNGSRFVRGDLEEKMREKCSELGVEFIVHDGTESVKDQMKLFSEADVVIGPHGAGMANILFSKPGTSVRLFPMVPRTDDFVRYLSAALDLNFQEVDTVLSTWNGNYGELSDAQIEDVLDAITDAVNDKKDKGENCVN